MKLSIQTELLSHIEDKKQELTTKQINEDLHYYCFNEDYYLIGYYECSEWLKKHDLGEFEALQELQDLQKFHFGEAEELESVNSETVVNELVYFYGLELI